MKTRVYIDTSVIGGCKDEEFSYWSNRIIVEVNKGKKIAVISDLTRQELEGAPEDVKKIFLSLSEKNIEDVSLSRESEELAKQYVKNKAVGSAHIVDAQHIAIATLEKVDVLVSWNFRHIVNLERIHAFNSVNLKLGYPILEIRSPREVLDEKEI